ncbi:MAG: GTPase ObgE [Deltaproteobacteria bacterium]|nr:GTPase ObgE [Deltaproteobacteria bacterium]
MKFIDEAILEVIAGHGGKGCVSFRREKYVPRGGPDGGNGGRGGHVILTATHNMSTLMDFRYKKELAAEVGHKGMGGQCEGRCGMDLVVPVPVGTVVYDNETNEIMIDFTIDGQQGIIAKGGRGGKGNAFFVTSTRQTPRFAQAGEEGEKKTVRLELKLLADVGLIGCPNAGKSTFLSVVSKARPKIADYPFTTVEPCLGVVQYGDCSPFVVADLPGLIEGAHEGRGMGDRFLKHAERTRIMLHMISVSPEEETTPLERYAVIKKEVASYYRAREQAATGLGTETTAACPREIVVFSKIDLIDAATLAEFVRDFTRTTRSEVVPVSSATGKNVAVLLKMIGQALNR